MVWGLALKPQNINNSAINGESIVRPWEKGRRLILCLIGAAMTTNDALTVTVQMRRKGTSTWDAAKKADGSTDLTFTVAKTSDTGVLENGMLHGELDLSRLQRPSSSYEYDAVRISAVNAAAQNVIVGAVYAIGDLIAEPDSTNEALEDLLAKQIDFVNA
jgi:hypothetical protein